MVLEVIRTSPKQSPMYGKLLLRESYDVSLGIFDHVAQSAREKEIKDPSIKRPLALVAMHDAEDTTGAVDLAAVATAFADLKISERFGLSFEAYLNLPTSYCRVLMEVAEKLQERDSRVVKNVASDLNRDIR